VAGPGYEPSPAVYGKAGQPCPRCAFILRSRGQGDDNRTTYWCAQCQV
jgi:endonuclease-8